LHPASISILLTVCSVGDWPCAKSAEARLHFDARSLSRRAERGLHTAALYGAFALIAAVVFGTLSVRPF
jgi:hypothetical protein